MNVNHNLAETDIDFIDIKTPLEHQIQQQELRNTAWRFDKINSRALLFYKIGEMNGKSFVKIPSRFLAILNIEIDKYCFIWSKLAKLHLCNNIHPNRVSKCRPYFDESNIEVFDFSNGIKCSDMHKFEKLNNLAINIIELNFYQDKKNGNKK